MLTTLELQHDPTCDRCKGPHTTEYHQQVQEWVVDLFSNAVNTLARTRRDPTRRRRLPAKTWSS